MLTLQFLLPLILIHQGRAVTDNLDELLSKHPTWSFQLESVEALLKNAAEVPKLLDSHSAEDIVKAKIKASLPPGITHIVRKVDDPKWIKDPRKIPSFFDAREQWKNCAEIISYAEDEGHCHTDGPAVVASVIADRYCIFTNGTFKERLSQNILTGCAEMCTRDPRIYWSWRYATLLGIPTGGPHGSNQGCLPNPDSPCLHTDASYVQGSSLEPCSQKTYYDHDCPTKCSNKKYSKSLENDRKKLTTWYVTSWNEFAIRNEILAYGPVATSIILYEDFFANPNGMYQKKPGSKFVAWDKYFKLIGWGEENGIKYWLAVNTWDSWGNKVFKIPRGVNHCYVEFILTTGVFEDLG